LRPGALVADALTVAEVAELLAVGRQTPHDRVRAQTLLAVKDNGRLVFPDWQFDPDGPDGVIPGLPDALAAMRGPISAFARVRWFLTPKSLMGGMTPLDALRAGAVEDVVAEAETIGIS
jgi:excisionase family DNA binding protein